MQNLFHAHFENHVGMSADPRSARRNIAQHRIEHSSCLSVLDRVDPDEHPVEPQELLANLVDEVVSINRRFRVNADGAQLLEYAAVAVVPRRRFAACLAITTPEQRHPARIFSRSRPNLRLGDNRLRNPQSMGYCNPVWSAVFLPGSPATAVGFVGGTLLGRSTHNKGGKADQMLLPPTGRGSFQRYL